LIANGASVVVPSKNGSTPIDIATALGFEDIVDIIASKSKSENDPSLPKFRQWLCQLGAGEYVHRFIDAGYDLPFLAKHGLTDQDLDCVGIPMSKLGLRRKIIALHQLGDFYDAEAADEDEEGEDEGGDEDDDDDDADEDED